MRCRAGQAGGDFYTSLTPLSPLYWCAEATLSEATLVLKHTISASALRAKSPYIYPYLECTENYDLFYKHAAVYVKPAHKK